MQRSRGSLAYMFFRLVQSESNKVSWPGYYSWAFVGLLGLLLVLVIGFGIGVASYKIYAVYPEETPVAIGALVSLLSLYLFLTRPFVVKFLNFVKESMIGRFLAFVLHKPRNAIFPIIEFVD